MKKIEVGSQRSGIEKRQRSGKGEKQALNDE
jgi:hypothetical protein